MIRTDLLVLFCVNHCAVHLSINDSAQSQSRRASIDNISSVKQLYLVAKLSVVRQK